MRTWEKKMINLIMRGPTVNVYLVCTTYVDRCDSLIFDASLFNHQYGFVNLLLRKFTSLEEMSKYKNDYSRI